MVTLFGFAALVSMFIPITVLIRFSFNKPEGAFNCTWTAFWLDAWLHPCADPSLCAAVGLSLKIAVLATLAATVVGTIDAFGLVRHNFRGQGVVNIVIFVPMATFPMYVWARPRRRCLRRSTSSAPRCC